MNAMVDPRSQGDITTAAPPQLRIGLTARDERMLAMREEGALGKEIGAALGISARQVADRVATLRKAGHAIVDVTRDRARARASRTYAEQCCEHRVYVVPVDPAASSPAPARPRANAEALRQHREAVELRRRMESMPARVALVLPTPPRIVAPKASVCEPIGHEPQGEQVNTHVLAWLWGRRLARAHPVQRVVLIVARHFRLEAGDITGPRRTANIARPRHVAMYLAKVLTAYSLLEIGRRFGGRDHTTVLWSVRKIEALVASDPEIGRDVTLLGAMLEEG